MLYVDFEREEGKMLLSKEMQIELTTGLAYYTNYLKDEIYVEKDSLRKKQLRERLFTATKLYYVFEQETIRVRTGPEFHHNWKKFSEELTKDKLRFG